MILDGKDIGYGIDKIIYNNCIMIASNNNEYELYLSFNTKPIDLKTLELNKKINLHDYLYWDNTLKTPESYYLFDTDKDDIYLTRIDDNKYRLEISIINPDMIYTPLGENVSFKSLIIDKEISFEDDK